HARAAAALFQRTRHRQARVGDGQRQEGARQARRHQRPRLEAPAGAADAGEGMMRPAVALAALAALAGCAESDPRRRAEQAWERCDSITLLNDARLEACTTVIDYEAAPAQRRVVALIVRGTIRANLGQYTRAVADFGRALPLRGGTPHASLERGAVHQTRGVQERALRDFDLALAIDPQMSAALERREQALNGSAEAYSNQLNRLTAMLAQAPTDPLLLNNRCWLRVTNDDDLDAALADCNAALLA